MKLGEPVELTTCLEEGTQTTVHANLVPNVVTGEPRVDFNTRLVIPFMVEVIKEGILNTINGILLTPHNLFSLLHFLSLFLCTLLFYSFSFTYLLYFLSLFFRSPLLLLFTHSLFSSCRAFNNLSTFPRYVPSRWLMAAGTALCVVPTTGRWRAGVFSR